MNQGLTESASRLVTALESDDKGAISKDVVAFAQTYAPSREQTYAAIALARLLRKEETRDACAEQLKTLILEIVEGYSAELLDQRLQQERRRDDLVVAAKVDEELPVAVVNGVEREFAGSEFKLGPVFCELPPRSVTGVVGANANGKTVLIELFAGVASPNRGEIVFPAIDHDGSAWTKRKKKIAYVPQELDPWHTDLRTGLIFSASMSGATPAEQDERVAFVIARFGLSEFLEQSWKQLSTGTKLKFALAQAIVKRPQLLVLDEPLANLDVPTKTELVDDLKQLANSARFPMAVLITSHDVELLEAVSDQMIHLRAGRQVTQKDSSKNVFRIRAEMRDETLAVLHNRLADAQLRHDGVDYFVTTDKAFSYQDLVTLLVTEQIEFTAATDISDSVVAELTRQDVSL